MFSLNYIYYIISRGLLFEAIIKEYMTLILDMGVGTVLL